jgi:hypothetical protein
MLDGQIAARRQEVSIIRDLHCTQKEKKQTFCRFVCTMHVTKWRLQPVAVFCGVEFQPFYAVHLYT